jgi:hypothetical protein
MHLFADGISRVIEVSMRRTIQDEPFGIVYVVFRSDLPLSDAEGVEIVGLLGEQSSWLYPNCSSVKSAMTYSPCADVIPKTECHTSIERGSLA